jgi:hypothetical protein
MDSQWIQIADMDVGDSTVLDLTQTIELIDAIILPLVGCIALFYAKFREGSSARIAERHFLGVLVVMSIVTLRTVIDCNDVWLVHTTALGTLIIASLMIPSQDSTPEIA